MSDASRAGRNKPAASTRAASGDSGQVQTVADFLAGARRLFVLTGAGISTGSGIPDYRDRNGGWKGASPIQHQDFMQQLAKRKRYWARSMAGWPAVAAARPNDAHRALAALGAAQRLSLLVTQNVDGLHQAAGSRGVVDLHGRLDRVICMACSTRVARADVQRRLIADNPGWRADADGDSRCEDGPPDVRRHGRPDGDIELGEVDYDQFQVPDCPVCGGVLKPDVVFFGGAVPRPRVERAWAGLRAADAVLVAGSSLMVWSGFRFIREAAARGLPIMAINHGRTRADELITHKIDADCGPILAAAVREAGTR